MASSLRPWRAGPDTQTEMNEHDGCSSGRRSEVVMSLSLRPPYFDLRTVDSGRYFSLIIYMYVCCNLRQVGLSFIIISVTVNGHFREKGKREERRV